MKGKIIEKREKLPEGPVVLVIEIYDDTGLYDILRFYEGKVRIEDDR